MEKQKGFGFIPEVGKGHFVLEINSQVILTHCWYGEENSLDRYIQKPVVESSTSVEKWNRVKEYVKSNFNLRLKEQKLKSGSWKKDMTYLDTMLGKELAVLFWGLNGNTVENAYTCFQNWSGFAPEERWFLYLSCKNSSAWREAIGIILKGDN